MRTIVTGASGFLGTNLTARLQDFETIPHKNIQSTDFSGATKVFFCSTYGNMASHTDIDAIVQANILDLAHTLKTIDWKTIRSFVYISSSSVKLKVQSMYSRTKKSAEELLLGYMENYSAPITIIRPYSITGVGEQPAHLIPTLIRSIATGTPINLSPDPVHDFIDIDDAVSGVLNLSNNQARGIYELGNGISYSNREVLMLVEQEMGKKATVNIVHGMRPYDNETWVSTNFKSRNWGWFPRKKLETSIKEMVKAYAN